MCGTILPLPQHTFTAWCSVQESTGTTLPFYLLYVIHSMESVNLHTIGLL
jgi:hypothetical protein